MKKVFIMTAIIGALGLAGFQAALAHTPATSASATWGYVYCGTSGPGMGHSHHGGLMGPGGHMMGW